MLDTEASRVEEDATRTPHGDGNGRPLPYLLERADATRTPHGDGNLGSLSQGS